MQVTDGALSIPIRAECVVPKLTLSSQVLEFGEVYLRHPYRRTVRLHNDSKLPAKYEVLPQDPQVRAACKEHVKILTHYYDSVHVHYII